MTKAVLLCGGLGTRLRPLTYVYNKNLLPLGNKFLIDYPLEAIKKAGIKEVLIITGPEQIGDLVERLSQNDHGLDITYKIQKEPLGIAHGIGLAENFVGEYNDVLVILGDNVFDDNLSKMLEKKFDFARVACYEVGDSRRFGVPTFENGKIAKITEKPTVPDSTKAIVGIYLYPSDVFEKIKSLGLSPRGEYEVSDLNNLYIEEGRMEHYELEGFWVDAGTHETYQKAFAWASTNSNYP